MRVIDPCIAETHFSPPLCHGSNPNSTGILNLRDFDPSHTPPSAPKDSVPVTEVWTRR